MPYHLYKIWKDHKITTERFGTDPRNMEQVSVIL